MGQGWEGHSAAEAGSCHLPSAANLPSQVLAGTQLGPCYQRPGKREKSWGRMNTGPLVSQNDYTSIITNNMITANNL